MSNKIGKIKKAQIWDKARGRCWYCGMRFNRENGIYFEIDHFIPKAIEGSDDIENLVPACSKCNHLKSDLPVSLFRIIAMKNKVLFPDGKFYFERIGLLPENYRKYDDFCNEDWYLRIK